MIAAAGAAFFLTLFGSCTPRDYSQSKSEFLLGTVCTIRLFDKADGKLLTRVFERVREIEEKMSANLPTSEVAAINATAGVAPAAVSGETLFVVEKALNYGDVSAGTFDITIGPLVKLWGIGTDNARIPAPSEIEALLPLVNYKDVILDNEAGTVYLPRQGLAIDLGGIAKGYAADEAARILRENGVSRAIIDFGGNILALGAKEKGRPWRIGVQNPFGERGEYAAIVPAEDASLVSSGNYERFFIEDGRRYHHILDVKTGYPVENGLADVTIVAASSIDADGLSTAVFSLGLSAGYRLLTSLPGVEGLLVTTEMRIVVTPGLTDSITLADPAFTLAAPPE